MARNDDTKIYSATYSNVPVYEYNVDGNHVMRRRSDDYINATHILKVADYDKPTRTRILEREVQKGKHEKVQGGYGKYQGTWIPLQDGRVLAERNGVLHKLLPMFDFVPGDSSPPPAPKHATAASKPRAPRASAAQRKMPREHNEIPKAAFADRRTAPTYNSQPDYDRMDMSIDMTDDMPDHDTVASESAFDDYDIGHGSARKRRRVDDAQSQAETQRRLWADELLDYFMLKDSTDDALTQAPLPPPGADLNLPIDDKGHTPLHWAAAMGDYEVVKELVRRGASIEVQTAMGETPLMFATLYTNCSDRQIMDRVASVLIRTVNMQDWYGGTVFHAIANSTERKSKYQCARYYLDCILDKMVEFLSPDAVEQILNEQDNRGDTAILVAARNGARKCVRSLIGRNAAVEIANSSGETADQYIAQLNRRRQDRQRQMSSSPFQDPDGHSLNGKSFPFDPLNPSVYNDGNSALSLADGAYRSEAALTLTSQIMPSIFSKAKQLATSFDQDIAEKDAELVEAKRLVELRQNELEALRRQSEEYTAREMEQLDGPYEDDVIETTLNDLEEQTMSLLEADQIIELAKHYEQEASRYAVNGNLADENGMDIEHSLQTKKSLAKQIIALKEERHMLMYDVLKKTSYAGIEDGKHAQYARLIKIALNIDEKELHSILPEIAVELENGQALEVAGV